MMKWLSNLCNSDTTRNNKKAPNNKASLGIFLAASVLLANPLYAADTTTVYKKKNADGSVTYSDQPIENAEKLEVAPVPTVPAYKPPPSQSVPAQDKTEESYYQSLTILQPANNTAFYSGNGDVTVTSEVTPALRRGHQFQFSLDGQVVSVQKEGQYTFRTLDRGSHTVSVTVLDRNQSPVLSNSSTFTVHRPKVKN